VNAVLLGAAGLLLAAQSLAQPELRASSEQTEGSPEDVTLAVLDVSGNHLGSAVSIQTGKGLLWAVTNRHVVGNLSRVCLASKKGIVYKFNVISSTTDKRHNSKLDIAFLWAPIESTRGLPVARWQNQPGIKADTLPIVEALGYPASSYAQGMKAELSKSSGLVVPILDDELEEGFDVTYTAQIQKGMSGGGVFANQRLVAINGAHSEPLWPVTWQSRAGKPIAKDINEKLALVSIGISMEVISRELREISAEPRMSSAELDNAACKGN